MKPLFMWAGGKKKMLKKYKKHLPKDFNGYCEPFLGGGAMFVWAYEQNPNARFILNDVNRHVMDIYRGIREDLPAFLKRLDALCDEYLPLKKGKTDKALEKKLEKNWAQLYEKRPCRRYFYFKTREEYAFEYEKWSEVEEAATLYFLMKTGFNGVWQVNKNTNGRFGTPCGLLNHKDSVYDKETLLEWHEALQSCELFSRDFKETLNKIGPNYYVFLDPPYRGCFTQYGAEFEDEAQQEVIDYLNRAKALGAYVLLSNRDVGDGFFAERKGSNEMVGFDVTYTAGRRKKTDEGFEAKKAKEILMIGKPE
jgi:DNA adenine methylase